MATKIVQDFKFSTDQQLKASADNFLVWNERIDILADAGKCKDHLFSTIEELVTKWQERNPESTPVDLAKKRRAIKDKNAALKLAIISSLTDDAFSAYSFQNLEASQVYDSIVQRNEPITGASKLNLSQEFYAFKQRSGESVMDTIIKFKLLINKNRRVGNYIEDRAAIAVFINGLSGDYSLVTELCADESFLEPVFNRILDKERRDCNKEHTAAMATGPRQSDNRPRRDSRDSRGRGGRGNSGRGNREPSKLISCDFCGFKGHHPKECFSKDRQGHCGGCAHFQRNCPHYVRIRREQGTDFVDDNDNAAAAAARYEYSDTPRKQQPHRDPEQANERRSASGGGGAQVPRATSNPGYTTPLAHTLYITRSRVTTDDTHDVAGTIHAARAITTVDSNDSDPVWVVDSGATVHIKQSPHGVTNIKPASERIRIANGSVIVARHSGDYKINKHVTLHDVLIAPDIKMNLLSVPRLASEGFEITLDNRNVYFRVGESVVLYGTKVKNTYLVHTKNPNVPKSSLSSHHQARWTSLDDRTLHRRLGHVGPKRLGQVTTILRGLGQQVTHKRGDNCRCNVCSEGKAKRKTVPKVAPDREKYNPGEKFHVDAAGPLAVTSLEGNKYFLTITDESTRYTQVTFHSEKWDFTNHIKETLTQSETKHGRSVKALQVDGAREFTGTSLTDWCKQKGIALQVSAPNQQWQNGIAERMNYTLFDSARCLLLDKEVPPYMWERAIHTAAYVRNTLPTAVLPPDLTPHYLWHGRHADYTRLRIFGSVAWVAKEPKGKKWEARGIRGIMVGYADHYKAYNIYIPDKGNVIPAVHVTFDETQSTAHLWGGRRDPSAPPPVRAPYCRPNTAHPPPTRPVPPPSGPSGSPPSGPSGHLSLAPPATSPAHTTPRCTRRYRRLPQPHRHPAVGVLPPSPLTPSPLPTYTSMHPAHHLRSHHPPKPHPSVTR
mmetsp:Transcript_28088/g.64805  ORF Transcript_28088/g.64805 Transcript_28088/m.64805 type:complete len:949 (+) Transcript_28088:100-2946(+)